MHTSSVCEIDNILKIMQMKVLTIKRNYIYFNLLNKSTDYNILMQLTNYQQKYIIVPIRKISNSYTFNIVNKYKKNY